MNKYTHIVLILLKQGKKNHIRIWLQSHVYFKSSELNYEGF